MEPMARKARIDIRWLLVGLGVLALSVVGASIQVVSCPSADDGTFVSCSPTTSDYAWDAVILGIGMLVTVACVRKAWHQRR